MTDKKNQIKGQAKASKGSTASSSRRVVSKPATQRQGIAIQPGFASLQADELDPSYAEDLELHTGVRLFLVELTYVMSPTAINPMVQQVADNALVADHSVQLSILGHRNKEIPAFQPYPTHDEVSQKEDITQSRHAVTRITDEVASYYGYLAGQRFVLDNNSQVTIRALSVQELVIPHIFLNGVAQ